MTVDSYPPADSGAPVKRIFGRITPDAPIVSLLSAYLGHRVAFATHKVGNDGAGKNILKLLSKYKVTTNSHTSSKSSTPLTIVISDANSYRTWFTHIAGMGEELSLIDLSLLERCRIAYIDVYNITQAATERALRHAVAHRIPLYINLGNESASPSIVTVLRQGDVRILQSSADFTREDQYQNVSLLKEQINPNLLIVTSGVKGAICITRKGAFHTPAFAVSTVHNNGAGAAFAAGAIHGFLNAWTPQAMLRFASALGGLYCSIEDGIGIFDEKKVQEFLVDAHPIPSNKPSIRRCSL